MMRLRHDKDFTVISDDDAYTLVYRLMTGWGNPDRAFEWSIRQIAAYLNAWAEETRNGGTMAECNFAGIEAAETEGRARVIV